MADNSIFEILIRFGLDDTAAKKAVASIKQVEQASDAAGKKTAQAAQSGALFKDVAAYALKTAAAYVSIGAAISFISSAVNQYVQRAGYTEAASRGWLLATQDIQSATDDIGKIVAEKVLPLYKELAAFIKGPVVDAIKEAANAADLLNKGPGIIKDTITEHEKNLKASDTTYKDYSAEYDRNFVLKMLAFMGTSGLKDVFQAITDPTGAKGTKGGLWLAQNKKMSESEWNNRFNVYTPTQTGVGGRGSMPGGRPQALEDPALLSEQKKFFERQLQIVETERVYQRQLFVMKRDFDRQETYATEDFNRQRVRSLRDFNMQMQYSESEFYRQRAISQRDFNISVARNEYDYQLSRKRATEDHNFSLKQIMLSGDALAYYYSQRQFEIDKQRAEEDYQLQKKRASEDFDRQQGDALAQFNISRAFQKKMFEISRADQLIDFNIQRKRAAEQFQIQRQDAEYQYSEMARLRQQGWTLELLATKNTATQIAWYRHRQGQNEINTMKAIDDFALASYNYVRTIFAQMGGSGGSGWSGMPGVPSYDTGGYTKGGLANTHNGEFVMNADTTKAAERLGKTNRLTQESIVSAMTGGGMNYVDNRTFSRGLTADEKQDLRQELRQMVMEAYN